jgi:hypothetical protein
MEREQASETTAALQQHVSIRQHSSAYVSIRQHTSAYVIIRHHTSAYVSIRQHTSILTFIAEQASETTAALQQHVAHMERELEDKGPLYFFYLALLGFTRTKCATYAARAPGQRSSRFSGLSWALLVQTCKP